MSSKSTPRPVLYLVAFSITMLACQSKVQESSGPDYPIRPVPFTRVDINDGFWAPRLETNREVTVPYVFQKCEETGRIRNFAIAGGLEEGEFEGIFFNDSDVFKAIEGACYSLHVHDDPELKAHLDDLISKIAAAQEEDGYLYTNRTIDPSKAKDGAGEERWTGLWRYHELYNVGHMYEAAVAHYQATGERSLLDVAIRNADLIDQVFGPGKNMGVPGHEEIEMGLVKLYRVTGDKKYLDIASFFVDQRGNAEGHDLYQGRNPEYRQDHMPLEDQAEAVGHSVRAGYFYAGATDVAALTGEQKYDHALDRIWESIIHEKIYLTGGIGSIPDHEGFGPAYELPNATAYTETCAAIALMLWNHRMFLRTGEVKYMDVFERTLYNGFLAGVSFEGNTFFYPNPLESDGEFEFNQGVCGRSPWFNCSCCPVNVVRIIPSIPGYIYAVKDNELFVNLYIGNEAEVTLGEEILELEMQTEYPWDGIISLSIRNHAGIRAAFNLRIPGWVRNEVMPGDLYRYADTELPSIAAYLNGNEIDIDSINGYLRMEERIWQQDDQILLDFGMPVRQVASHEMVSANRGKTAFERGPLVYCAEEIDNPAGVLEKIAASEESFEYEFDPSLFEGTGMIKGDLSLIPYYAWAHRGTGQMAVWLRIH